METEENQEMSAHWKLLRSETISCNAIKEACDQLWEEAVVDILKQNCNIKEICIDETVSESIVDVLMSKPGIEKVKFDKFNTKFVTSTIADLIRKVTVQRFIKTSLEKVDRSEILCEALETKSLQHIHLNEVHFGDSMARTIAQSPVLWSSLESFEMCNSKLGTKGFDTLARALPLFSSLQKLKIVDHRLVLDNDRALAFTEATKNHETLTSLIFCSIIPEPHFNKVLAQFVTNSSLSCIDLECLDPCYGVAYANFYKNGHGLSLETRCRRSFGPREFGIFCDALFENDATECLSLKCLKFCRQGISIGIGKQGMISIGQKLLPRCSALTKLDLSHNRIGDDRIVLLCDKLLPNDTLQELDLTWNQIGDRGAVALARCIANKTLSPNALVLHENRIGESGVVALAQCQCLTKLKLSFNGIGDNATVSFCEALSPYNTLQDLDLSGNGIGDTGAAALAQCIANKKLFPQTLVLAWNRIGDNGMMALAGCLAKEGHSLKKLYLNYNPFGDEGRNAIVDALSSRTRSSRMEVIHFHGWNRFEDNAYESLGKMLHINSMLKEILFCIHSSATSITERGIRALLNGVKVHPTITKVYLPDRTFTALQFDELEYYLELNRGPKHLLQSKQSLPRALWPRVLKRADRCRDAVEWQRAPDVLYFLVKENCEFFAHRASVTNETIVAGVKEEQGH